ncbi:MAG: ribonuclease D [Pseudohongiellaceae bacterium]
MNDSLSPPDPSVLQPQLITDDGELHRLCQYWGTLPVLAMDTEFIRVDTFYPQLGLLQVCDGRGSYLLDPLVLEDWAAFRALLADEAITKVLHACSEDLLVFNEYFGVIPKTVFDTQKAAAFLGLGYSISYQNLVRELLGIEVDKGETRSDWLRRPLSEQQLHYAALDVAYLPAIHARMSEHLDRNGHLADLLDECDQMTVLAALTEDEKDWDTLYLNMGAAWRLDRGQLAILRALSRWREREARRLNIPRPWVAKDSDLILLAQQAPDNRQSLRGLGDLSRAARDVDADVLLELIGEAHRQPVPADAVPAGQPLGPAQRRTLKRCQAMVRKVAEEQGVAVELLARKKQLITLLELAAKSDWQWPEELGGWRRQLLEPSLRPLLNGEEAAKSEASSTEET